MAINSVKFISMASSFCANDARQQANTKKKKQENRLALIFVC